MTEQEYLNELRVKRLIKATGKSRKEVEAMMVQFTANRLAKIRNES